jgi:hypothetical protein
MQKFKIFMGSSEYTADIEANKWLEKNPNIEIIDVRYQQARYSDHSICILYREG